MASTPVQMLTGSVVMVGASLGVDVRGSVIAASWVTGYVPVVGDTVRVLVVDSLATILGPVHASPRPMSGTVSAASGGLATVSTSAGTVTARYMGPAPAALALVRLDWSTSKPWILGPITDVPADDTTLPKPTPVPPPTSDEGVLTIAATWTGSWRPAPKNEFEYGSVVQGTLFAPPEYQGVWGGHSQAALKSLQGLTITKTELRIGARGSFHPASSVMSIWRSSRTTAGAPALTDGPYDQTITQGPAQWITVPNALGNALKSGGSVALKGSGIVDTIGRNFDAMAGTLRISWRK